MMSTPEDIAGKKAKKATKREIEAETEDAADARSSKTAKMEKH